MLHDLDTILGGIEDFIAERVGERNTEVKQRQQALDRAVRKLAEQERQPDKLLNEYADQVAKGESAPT